MIYKSIADRLRLRLNSADRHRQPATRREKTGRGVRSGARDYSQSHRSAGGLGIGCASPRLGNYVARKDVHHETSNLTGLAEVLRKQVKRW